MSVSDELRALRLEKRIPARELADAIREIYPRFDKALLSKVEHGVDYGVSLRPDVMDALYRKFAPELLEARRRARMGGNRLTCRISARLEEGAHSALQRQIRADGYATTQDWVADMVYKYLGWGSDHG